MALTAMGRGARNANAYMDGSVPLVCKVPHLNGDTLSSSVTRAVRALGGIDKVIARGDRVLIKPNFNCEYALPLSTDLAFLAAVIELLLDQGARVVVGEMSGRAAGPTERVICLLGVQKVLQRYGVPFIDFEKDQRIALEVEGEYWQALHVPRTIYETDKRVYLANMRPHSTARYSASLKLSVGWISAEDRELLHSNREDVGRKIPELNLGWQPDLVLVDGRRSTVTWHGRGKYIYPNVIMASGDMVAIDSEAVRILKRCPGDNRLDVPLETIEQLGGAAALGLGSMKTAVIELPANLRTEQKGIEKEEVGPLRGE